METVRTYEQPLYCPNCGAPYREEKREMYNIFTGKKGKRLFCGAAYHPTWKTSLYEWEDVWELQK